MIKTKKNNRHAHHRVTRLPQNDYDHSFISVGRSR